MTWAPLRNPTEWQRHVERMRSENAAYQARILRDVRAQRRREELRELGASLVPYMLLALWLLVLGALADAALGHVLAALAPAAS